MMENRAGIPNTGKRTHNRETQIEALMSEGARWRQQGDLEAAISSYQQIFSIDEKNAAAWYAMGVIANQIGLTDSAISFLRQAVLYAPREPAYINELAQALITHGDEEGAANLFREGLGRNPGHPVLLNNLGNLLQNQGRLEEAIDHYRGASAAAPEMGELQWNLALALLMNGNLHEGWERYEVGLQSANQRPSKSKHLPYSEWDGSPLNGKNILLYAEQGVGDEIMFASCIPDLLRRSPETCIVECDPRLAPLLARSFPEAIFCGEKQGPDEKWLTELPSIDLQVATGSLPLHFRRDIEEFPNRNGGYLIPDPEQEERWKRRFDALGSGLKIGISWRGGKNPTQQQKRTITLSEWEPILTLPGIHFINLQYGECSSELRQIRENTGIQIHDWEDADPLKNLDSQAAQIASLDLVISVDNSTVHMAGAVGTETWAILPHPANWRWMVGRSDTPWYVKVRLLRSTLPDRQESGTVINNIAQQLESYCR